MVTMTLCPNCRTIQKAGDPCPLCKCPIRHPREDNPGSERPNDVPADLEPEAA